MEGQQKQLENWTEGERPHAIELILKKQNSFCRKFRGASLGVDEKEKKCDDILEKLNA